jgi:hypothetical protein
MRRFLEISKGTDLKLRTKQRSALEDLLRKAQAARPSTCEVESSARLETPFFDQAVERAGGAEKKSIEELLTESAGPVDSSTIPQFPTAQCLTAEDVYVVESLQPEKQVHLESCPWCKTMVAVA